jgi:hypothetical protein
MSDDNDDDDNGLIEAFRLHDEMEATRHYLAEGRRYAGLDDDRLKAEWLRAMVDFLVRMMESGRDESSDLGAELRLRGLPLPELHLSPAERQQMLTNVRTFGQDPQLQKRLEADLEQFLKQLAAPKN